MSSTTVFQSLLETYRAIVIKIQYLLIEILDKYITADETILFSKEFLNPLFFPFCKTLVLFVTMEHFHSFHSAANAK